MNLLFRCGSGRIAILRVWEELGRIVGLAGVEDEKGFGGFAEDDLLVDCDDFDVFDKSVG